MINNMRAFIIFITINMYSFIFANQELNQTNNAFESARLNLITAHKQCWVSNEANIIESNATFPFIATCYCPTNSEFEEDTIDASNKKSIRTFIEKTNSSNNSLLNKHDNAMTQLELNFKARDIADFWDSRLIQLWQCLQNEMPSSRKQELLKEQYAWLKEKQKVINIIQEKTEGGSIQPLSVCSAKSNLTRKRVYELAEYLSNLRGEQLMIQIFLENAYTKSEIIEDELNCDCAKTLLDVNEKSIKLAKFWDDRLAQIWQLLQEQTPSLRKQELLKEQHEWTKQKQNAIKSIKEDNQDSFIQTLSAHTTQYALTRERVYELAKYLAKLRGEQLQFNPYLSELKFYIDNHCVIISPSGEVFIVDD
ncbi:MAG: lysozyme inhibitor LprI family protein [Campylobacter sp.]|nr:lysozyme inhibitor LprI family protein [Campylobacter sp.]